MKLNDAIEKVLRGSRKPLDAATIAARVLADGLWQTSGKTPAATVAAQIYMSIKRGERRFAQTGPGVFCLFGGKKPLRIGRETNDSGYVYILTNPCFRKDWVKIGKTSRPVDTRSKELDNTATPLPFEIYATLKTGHMTKIENHLHNSIDLIAPKLRIRPHREFFNINPERALKLLRDAAQMFDEEDDVTLGPDIADAPAKNTSRPAKSSAIDSPKESWSGKTQLAKLIARRGGNEGAFGGILKFFSDRGSKVRKPCHANSKWRQPLADAGVKFDKSDYVKDWEHAKNPL